MEIRKKYEELWYSDILCGNDRDYVSRLHIVLNYIVEAIDTLKNNFMLEGKDQYGNVIDITSYKIEINTLYKRKEMCIDTLRNIMDVDFLTHLKEDYDNGVLKKEEIIHILNIYNAWLREK